MNLVYWFWALVRLGGFNHVINSFSDFPFVGKKELLLLSMKGPIMRFGQFRIWILSDYFPWTYSHLLCLQHMAKQHVLGLTDELMKKGKHFILIRNPLDILVSCFMNSTLSLQSFLGSLSSKTLFMFFFLIKCWITSLYQNEPDVFIMQANMNGWLYYCFFKTGVVYYHPFVLIVIFFVLRVVSRPLTRLCRHLFLS